MKIIKLLGIIIVVLVIGNVTLTNKTVDESLVVAGLTKDITSLQNQNTILRADVASAGAIGNLTGKIADAGFVDGGKIAALSSPVSVASR